MYCCFKLTPSPYTECYGSQHTWNVDVVSRAGGVRVSGVGRHLRLGAERERVDHVGADLVLDAAVAVLPLDAGCHTEKLTRSWHHFVY